MPVSTKIDRLVEESRGLQSSIVKIQTILFTQPNTQKQTDELNEELSALQARKQALDQYIISIVETVKRIRYEDELAPHERTAKEAFQKAGKEKDDQLKKNNANEESIYQTYNNKINAARKALEQRQRALEKEYHTKEAFTAEMLNNPGVYTHIGEKQKTLELVDQLLDHKITREHLKTLFTQLYGRWDDKYKFEFAIEIPDSDQEGYTVQADVTLKPGGFLGQNGQTVKKDMMRVAKRKDGSISVQVLIIPELYRKESGKYESELNNTAARVLSFYKKLFHPTGNNIDGSRIEITPGNRVVYNAMKAALEKGLGGLDKDDFILNRPGAAKQQYTSEIDNNIQYLCEDALEKIERLITQQESRLSQASLTLVHAEFERNNDEQIQKLTVERDAQYSKLENLRYYKNAMQLIKNPNAEIEPQDQRTRRIQIRRIQRCHHQDPLEKNRGLLDHLQDIMQSVDEIAFEISKAFQKEMSNLERDLAKDLKSLNNIDVEHHCLEVQYKLEELIFRQENDTTSVDQNKKNEKEKLITLLKNCKNLIKLIHAQHGAFKDDSLNLIKKNELEAEELKEIFDSIKALSNESDLSEKIKKSLTLVKQVITIADNAQANSHRIFAEDRIIIENQRLFAEDLTKSSSTQFNHELKLETTNAIALKKYWPIYQALKQNQQYYDSQIHALELDNYIIRLSKLEGLLNNLKQQLQAEPPDLKAIEDDLLKARMIDFNIAFALEARTNVAGEEHSAYPSNDDDLTITHDYKRLFTKNIEAESLFLLDRLLTKLPDSSPLKSAAGSIKTSIEHGERPDFGSLQAAKENAKDAKDPLQSLRYQAIGTLLNYYHKAKTLKVTDSASRFENLLQYSSEAKSCLEALQLQLISTQIETKNQAIICRNKLLALRKKAHIASFGQAGNTNYDAGLTPSVNELSNELIALAAKVKKQNVKAKIEEASALLIRLTPEENNDSPSFEELLDNIENAYASLFASEVNDYCEVNLADLAESLAKIAPGIDDIAVRKNLRDAAKALRAPLPQENHFTKIDQYLQIRI